jgi:hypothetical protein
VVWHRLDADPYPEPTFHFDADPDSILIFFFFGTIATLFEIYYFLTFTHTIQSHSVHPSPFAEARLPKFYTCWKIRNCLFFLFLFAAVPFHVVYLSRQRHRCIIFYILASLLKFLENNIVLLRLKFC